MSQEITNQTENSPPQMFSQKPSQTSTQNTAAMIAEMVTQSYETLNTFSKTPEQLRTIIKAHRLVLGDKRPEDIREAYLMHLKSSANMPTPAEILHSVTQMEEIREIRSKAQSAGRARPAMAQKSKRVQWAGKQWHEFTQDDVNALAMHMSDLRKNDPERADGYAHYLKTTANVPSGAI